MAKMKRRTEARRTLRAAAYLLAAGLLSACTGPVQTLQALPESLRGKLQIVDVQVEKRRGITSVAIEPVLRQALLAALEERAQEGRAMNLVVVVEDYQGPEGQISGTRTSGLSSAKSHLQGRVFIVRPETGVPVAEFWTSAQYEPGGPGTSGSAAGATDIQGYLVERFATAVIEEIS